MNEIEHISHERAILVGAGERYAGRTAENDPLDELRMLADTAGAAVVGVVVQNRTVSDPAFHIGKGKVDEFEGRSQAPGGDHSHLRQ